MPVSNVVKVNLHWVGAGEEGEFGVWFQCNEAISQADLEGAAGDFANNWDTNDWNADLRSLLGADQHFDQSSWYAYNSLPGPADFSAVSQIADNNAGTGTSLTPLQSAVCVSLHTGHSGASYRGRIYLPLTGQGLSTGHLLDSSVVDKVAQIVAGTISDYDGYLTTIEQLLSSNGHASNRAVVYSPTLGVTNVITAVSVDNVSDTQRRRRNRQDATYTRTFPVQ